MQRGVLVGALLILFAAATIGRDAFPAVDRQPTPVCEFPALHVYILLDASESAIHNDMDGAKRLAILRGVLQYFATYHQLTGQNVSVTIEAYSTAFTEAPGYFQVWYPIPPDIQSGVTIDSIKGILDAIRERLHADIPERIEDLSATLGEVRNKALDDRAHKELPIAIVISEGLIERENVQNTRISCSSTQDCIEQAADHWSDQIAPLQIFLFGSYDLSRQWQVLSEYVTYLDAKNRPQWPGEIWAASGNILESRKIVQEGVRWTVCTLQAPMEKKFDVPNGTWLSVIVLDDSGACVAQVKGTYTADMRRLTDEQGRQWGWLWENLRAGDHVTLTSCENTQILYASYPTPTPTSTPTFTSTPTLVPAALATLTPTPGFTSVPTSLPNGPIDTQIGVGNAVATIWALWIMLAAAALVIWFASTLSFWNELKTVSLAAGIIMLFLGLSVMSLKGEVVLNTIWDSFWDSLRENETLFSLIIVPLLAGSRFLAKKLPDSLKEGILTFMSTLFYVTVGVMLLSLEESVAIFAVTAAIMVVIVLVRIRRE